MKKPAELVYGTEERAPRGVALVSGLQHVAVVAIFLVYPMLVAREAGISAGQVDAVLQLSMLALAVAMVLQALPRGPVGSRFLAPSIFTGIYLAPSLLAANVGGMPLVWGMTLFAGFVEMVLALCWSRLRAFVPPETAGMVVFLVGVIVGLAALRILLGDNPGGTLAGRDVLVAGVSLATMVALNIWHQGQLRLYAILLGMAVGYALSAFTGHLGAEQWSQLAQRPLLALPTVQHLDWTFDVSLVVPFAVTALAAAMSTTAVVTTYQRLTDADWVRPEQNSISRGILGDGMANAMAGALGTHGLTVSSPNVGLLAATGVASRHIAFVIAGLLALAAFVPVLVGVLTIMPTPVMAAVLLFTATFPMIGGIQIIASRVLDSRRTLVVGGGLLAFFSDVMYPRAFAGVPALWQPLTTSPLVLAALVALCLNGLFRIGIRQTVALPLHAAAIDPHELAGFIERAAGRWGARRDVTSRVESAVQQAVDALVHHCRVTGPMTLSLSFDEFDIDVRLEYVGVPLPLPETAPSHDELLASEDGLARMAGYLVRRLADRVNSSPGQGLTVLLLNFKH